MKEKIEKYKIIILVMILILIGAGFGIWFDYRQAIKNCKEECRYILPHKTRALESFGSQEYVEVECWQFGEYPKYRNFETQDQCIDYCLTVK